ncbi:hypothetical protein OIU77_008944 [Salix suchowensis]|uniref:Uncharacterized protein n=1 Tax=Salix suchowensis TaxID=1278906 RepID=A0ABQ9ADW1_9ROSI|nr:hypothetical protein OIU77_008944 [Salix suchowensis]
MAARLSKFAPVITLSTVVLVCKNIAAMFLAAVKQARACFGRDPVTNVRALGAALRAFLYGSTGQEPAS